MSGTLNMLADFVQGHPQAICLGLTRFRHWDVKLVGVERMLCEGGVFKGICETNSRDFVRAMGEDNAFA